MTDADGSAELSLSGFAGVGVGRSGSALLALSGLAGVGVGRSGSAALSVSATGLGVGVPPGVSATGGTYFQRMMARSPLAYWRFGGNLSDSASGHNAYLVKTSTSPASSNTAQYETSLLTGDPNPSITFQELVSAVATGGTWADQEEFTFEGFFEITETLEYPGAIVARASIEHFGWGLLLDDTDLLFCVGGFTDFIDLPFGVYHFAVTGDADTMKLYLNGVLVSTLPSSPDHNVDADFQFGAVLPGYSFEAFPGRMDEFVYLDHAISGLDVYADWQVWSLGQSGSIDMVAEVDSVGTVSPRFGSGRTYSDAVVDDNPWAYWSHSGYGSDVSDPDYGNRGHAANRVGTQVRELQLGPTQPDAEVPKVLQNTGYLESEDAFSSSTCTFSIWLAVSPIGGSIAGVYSGPILAEIPLVGMATAEGASTFDKCLYLDTSGRLCWLTDDGSAEVITDPDAFPQDSVARHVAVSVGPAGTKIRVSGVTKVTGANTSSLTAAQKIFYFTGGTGGGHDFTSEGQNQRTAWLQATVYDVQLDDAQTDEHYRVGRSVRNIEYFWGLNAIDSSGQGITSLVRSGATEHYTGPRGLLTSDPLLGSLAVTERVVQAIGGGTWHTSTGERTNGEIRHVYWEPTSLSGTQSICTLAWYTTQFSTSPAGVVSVGFYWRLRSIDGALTWSSTSVSNGSTVQDTFTHSTPIMVGVPNSIGMEIQGANVDLWVNGVKNSFTRTEAGNWMVVTDANLLAVYELGATIAVGPFPEISTHVMTGWVSEYLYNKGPSVGQQGGNGIYRKPGLFFEDLAVHVAERELVMPTIAETETVFDLIPVPDVDNQTLTIDMVVDDETVYAFPQSPAIQTIVETGEVFTFAQPEYLGEVTTQGAGRIILVDELVEFLGAEIHLTILETTVYRAPTSITVMLSGGVAQEDVVFAIDGTPVLTVSLDSNGELGPTSINLSAALGTAGDHTLSVTQTTDSGVTADSQTFTVLYEPSPSPEEPATPVPPVVVPGALDAELVRHWVFQDFLPGGIGSYILPHNPSSMTSPHYEHAFSSRHSTASDGKIHIFQAANTPKEWEFSGYCSTQAQQERMTEYRNLNRRFYVIDHRNRAWEVVIVSAEFVPRLRQNYNGIPTDWGSDYKMSVVVLNQDPTTPEEV